MASTLQLVSDGALAGQGADLFIIDDPHRPEQEAETGRPDVFLPAWEWFRLVLFSALCQAVPLLS